MLRGMRVRTIAWGLTGITMTAESAAESPVVLEDLRVRAGALEAATDRLSAEALGRTRSLNMGEAVTAAPGVAAVRRGANAAEPVIRGLGWERVQTRVGGLCLYGACPARMDPPATYVSPEAVESVEVIKGVPSVRYGHGGTGGHLVMDVDYDRGPNATPGLESDLRASWDEGRNGARASALSRGGTEDVDLRLELNAAELDDFESGGGRTVPAGLTEAGGSLSLGWRPAEGQRLYGALLLKEETDVDFPALPMNMNRSTSATGVWGYRLQRAGERLERLEIEGGFASVDHVMNNEGKPNRARMRAETDSEATAFAARIETGWRIRKGLALALGGDAERLERDALRERTMAATGMTLRDPIWPDVSRDLAGVFGEVSWAVSDEVSLRVGSRVDRAESEAGGAEDSIRLGMGMPPVSVVSQYERIYGPGAGQADAADTMLSGNILAEWRPAGHILWYAGVGKISRFPNVTEQYFAFAPAPGGFLVGNPALDPEEKYEADAGVKIQRESFAVDLAVFGAVIDDYIYQTTVDRADVNGDGTVDLVRGFRNVDAETVGGELRAVCRPGEQISVPATLAYVAGRNTTDGRDLPEIPPLSGSLGLRVDSVRADAWWVETGVRFSARQTRVDEAFPEDETASFQVVHLKGGLELLDGLHLEVGVENLFDEDYNEHLTREAVMPVGDLGAGDEIPAPGRFVYATARIEL